MKIKTTMVAVVAALALVLASIASADSISNATVDSSGHITVSWQLSQPSGSDTNFADFICVGEFSNGTCGGDMYSLPLFTPQTDTNYGSGAGSFTTPKQYAPGTYQVTLMADDVSVIYTNDYLNDSCSVSFATDFLFICGVSHDNYTTGSVVVPDTTPPSGVNLTVASYPLGTSVQVNWTAANDNVGVADYRLSRNGVNLGTVQGTSYTDKTAKPGTTYQYQVTAYDAAGNAGPTASATVTTPYECVVPNLKNMTLAGAAKKLRTSHCSLGHVTHVVRKTKIGRVINQSPTPGRALTQNGSVNVTVVRKK